MNYIMYNITNIVLVVLLLVVFMIITVLVEDKKESFKTCLHRMKSGFCKSFEKSDNRKKHNEACKELNKELCKTADCCSMAKYKNEKKLKCVASTKGEPIYKTSDKNNPLEYYYHKNKKHKV